MERIRRLLTLERSGNERLKEEWKSTRLPIHSIIGLSGPYNITHHFDFEAGRSVEQISPMKPANGNSHDMFPRYSPAEQLSKIYGQCKQKEQQLVQGWFPQVTLLHGTNDGTVPHVSTQEAVRVLRSSGVPHCKELLVEDVGHEECVMQIMLGGLVRDSLTQSLSELCQEHQ
jgi:hypothetical protein